MDGNDERSLSKCVRRFGIPEVGFDGDRNQEVEAEDESGEDDDEDEREDEEDEIREERSRRRKRRKLEKNMKDRMKDAHITAAKISQHSEVEEVSVDEMKCDGSIFSLDEPKAHDHLLFFFFCGSSASSFSLTVPTLSIGSNFQILQLK